MRLFGLDVILLLFWRASRVQKKRAILTVAAIAWGTLSTAPAPGIWRGSRNFSRLRTIGSWHKCRNHLARRNDNSLEGNARRT